VAVRDFRGALRVAVSGAGVFLAVNAPFMVANPSGWWATYGFQRSRPADITTNSIWFWGFPKLTTAQLNTITPVLLATAWLVALAVGFWRVSARGEYPWVQVSGAMLCAFLLLNKVHSPQYTLWLVPFFALISVRWGWWASFWASDLVLFLGLFSWYADIVRGGDFGLAKQAVIVGVWSQAVLLALLYVLFLSAPLAVSPPLSEPDEDEPDEDEYLQPISSPSDQSSDQDSSDQDSSERSAAPSSTPPAGSSIPDSRTTSYSG
jgi:hypothetical protein